MSNVVQQICVLFLLILIGYAAKRFNVTSKTADSCISRFLVYISMPATIIYSAANQQQRNSGSILPVFASAVAVFVFLPVISRIIVKLLKWEASFQLMLIYSNLGFMGIPIITYLFGEQYTFYVAIFMMIFNLSIYSYGIAILQQGISRKEMLRQLCNPAIISALIAIVVFLFKISIPTILNNLLGMLNGITSPLALIMIGSSLGDIRIKELFGDKKLYVFAFFKLIVYPVLVYAMLYPFLNGTVLLKICTVLTCLPTGANVTMLCSEYGGNMQLVSKGTFVSTLLSMASIWIILAVFC